MYRAYRNLCRFVMLLGGVGIFLMMANVTLDVFLKFVWNLPIQGTVEISSYYYMVSIVMLPMALVELDDEHVSVDLLFPHYPIWLQQTCLVLACGAAVGILSVMAWRTGSHRSRAPVSRLVSTQLVSLSPRPRSGHRRSTSGSRGTPR